MVTNALNLGPVNLPGIPLAAFDLPVTAGLEGLFFLSDGLAVAGINFAPGKPAAQVVGLPIAQAGYMSFSAATGYLQTQVPETADMTIVSILRRTVPGNTPFVGNYGAGAVPGITGVGIYTTANDRAYVTASRDAGASNAFAIGAVNSWALVAARMPAVGVSRIQNLTAGTTANTGTGNRVLSANGPMRVGRFYEAVFVAPNDAMMVAMFSKVLSDAELASVQVWAKEFAAVYGVTV